MAVRPADRKEVDAHAAATRTDALPPPAPPTAAPRYRRVAWTLAVGCAAALMAFVLVYFQLRTTLGVDRHWLPWVVLVLGLAAACHAAASLLNAVGTAVRHEGLAQERGDTLAAQRGRARAVLTRIRDAVVVTDARGRVLEWNDAAERALDLPAAQAVGRPCADALGIRLADRGLDCSQGCALLTLAKGRDEAVGVEVLRPRRDGSFQPLLASVGAVVSGDSDVVEVVHSLRDITRLRESDEAKTLFLATASHELRTPLAVIQGFTEMLSRRDIDQATRELAQDAILRRTHELARIIDRLLLASRLDRGVAEAHARQVEVIGLVEERVESYAIATGRPIRFVAGEQVTAWADPTALETVVDHLLDNALKYSPGGDPVEVEVDVEGEAVRLFVRDRGVGMDAEATTHCFDRFWQAEQGDTRRFGGTGIGLHIVRSLVEAMSGRVEVESEPGVGSTFAVVLRRHQPEAEPSRPVALVDAGRPASLVHDVLRHAGVRTST